MYDTGLANRVRLKGVRVVEVAGCQTRGSSVYSPKGHVYHHTASTSLPLRMLIDGRPDLPGPLCETSLDTDETCYVVACGRANHAGSGGWKGLSGNSSVSGLEIVHPGTYPLPSNLVEVACRIGAAHLEAPGASRDAALACHHFEWTSRKIDVATRTDPSYWRQRTQYWIGRTAGGSGPGPTPPPVQEDDMKPVMVQRPRDGAIFLLLDKKKWMRNWDEIGQCYWNFAAAGVPISCQANGSPWVWLDWQIDIIPPMIPCSSGYPQGDDFGDPIEIRQARAHQIQDAIQGNMWSTHDMLRGIHFHSFNADMDNNAPPTSSGAAVDVKSMATDLSGMPDESPDPAELAALGAALDKERRGTPED